MNKFVVTMARVVLNGETLFGLIRFKDLEKANNYALTMAYSGWLVTIEEV